MTAVTIRPERAEDAAAIADVTTAAFTNAGHGNGGEAGIIQRLREQGDLALSLVAENEARIVGHVALSPVTISDGSTDWYGLGPISVWPDAQGTGIGFRLMQRTIADMRARHARGIVLLGDPAFYHRFGFEHDAALVYPGPLSEYFQRLILSGPAPRGVVTYASAFA